MSLARRIIVCLDVDGGRVVKGVRFAGLRDVGDPVALATRYEAEGADEVVFLDITASHEGRGLLLEAVRRTAERLFVPLTVGGGIASVADMREALRAGADKVAINTAALAGPELIAQCAKRFGSQCVVVAVDAKRAPTSRPPRWEVFTHGGRRATGLDAVAWCRRAAALGAGEILLTSMDADGTRDGYDTELMDAVAGIDVPVVASGGCGTWEHMADAFRHGADAALAAGIFHDGLPVAKVKHALLASGIEVRA